MIDVCRRHLHPGSNTGFSIATDTDRLAAWDGVENLIHRVDPPVRTIGDQRYVTTEKIKPAQVKLQFHRQRFPMHEWRTLMRAHRALYGVKNAGQRGRAAAAG